jgi:RHS repeat-associated protein
MDGSMASINPLRYRGYYYDTETGFYYLNSRYYDPVICRFINADGYVSGDRFIGCNLFAYCYNNPVCLMDKNGESPEAAVSGWVASMWWLTLVDGPLPIGDIIFAVGAVVVFVMAMPELTVEYEEEPAVAEPFPAIMEKVEEGKYDKQTARHHIVAQNDHRHEQTRRILESLGISKHSIVNIVEVKKRLHVHLHTEIYYAYVSKKIMDAYASAYGYEAKKASVLSALGLLKAEIEAWNAIA